MLRNSSQCAGQPMRKKWSKCQEDPAIPLLGICPKKPETPIWKNIRTPRFIAALLTIVDIWKQSKHLSVDEWIKKLWYIYTMEYYLAITKKKILPIVTAWVDLEKPYAK